jgi:hypothetical protein
LRGEGSARNQGRKARGGQDVEQLLCVDLAVVHRDARRPRIQRLKRGLEVGKLGRIDQFSLGQQQPVRDCYLLTRFLMPGELRGAVFRIDGRHDAIEL